MLCDPSDDHVLAPFPITDISLVDCNDFRDDVHPGAPEIVGNGYDEDCNLKESCLVDADRDGFGDDTVAPYETDIGCTTPGYALAQVSGNNDCDDADPRVHPAADEVCNETGSEVDEDCDGFVDDDDTVVLGRTTWYEDLDGDGFGNEASFRSACHPRPDEVVNSEDCLDESPRPDIDPAEVNPAAPEQCNGFDDNCDGQLDEAAFGTTPPADLGAASYYPDFDNDYYVSPVGAVWACPSNIPPGWSAEPTDDLWDCRDNDPNVHPGITDEVGRGDRNCDDLIACYADADQDGFGDDIVEQTLDDLDCEGVNPDGIPVSATDGDCEDNNPDINPAKQEACDAGDVDENCNGIANNAELSLGGSVQGFDYWYPDSDGDGYGREGVIPQVMCPQHGAVGGVFQTGDCDDANDTVFPGAVEGTADGVDQDQDGLEACYLDDDDDGYGTALIRTSADVTCGAPKVASATDDCNDVDGTIHPNAFEVVADGIDQDCNGNDLCYLDEDQDGHGGLFTAQGNQFVCDDPSLGISSRNDDCDDDNPLRAPSLAEVCDAANLDEDCNGLADEADGAGDLYLRDADIDTFGTTTQLDIRCEPSAGWVLAPADLDDPSLVDCDDESAWIFPGAVEIIANSEDEDCDGRELCYQDNDGDGYGHPDEALAVLSDVNCRTNGANIADDCDDTTATVNPSQTERCDPASVDEDCSNGFADDDDAFAAGTQVYYDDLDQDGFGAQIGQNRCRPDVSRNQTLVTGDCNDVVAAINPDATERCDSIDNDCDFLIDDFDDLDLTQNIDARTWFFDGDADGFGVDDTQSNRETCIVPTGYTSVAGDCDDTSPLINPAVTEQPADGIDANCDLKELCYVDADDDGYGGSVTQPISDLTCNAPGFLPTSSDCDDTDPLLTTEERLWFADLDNDGLGNPNIHELACRPPAPTGLGRRRARSRHRCCRHRRRGPGLGLRRHLGRRRCGSHLVRRRRQRRLRRRPHRARSLRASIPERPHRRRLQ